MALEFLTFILKLFFLIFLIVLPFLYDLNARFRYYFKFFVFQALVTCVSVIFIPLALLKPFDVGNVLVATKLFNFISKVLNVRWKVDGVENLKLNESCILVSNHQSQLDLLGLLQIYSHLENPCTATMKKHILHASPFGIAAWLCGVIFIDKTEFSTFKHIMSSKIKQMKYDNVSILTFPEDDAEIHEFQKNVFYLAIKERLPIVPIVFSNYYFIDEKQKIFDPGNITIQALSPIPTENMSVDDASMLNEEVCNKMKNALHELSSKLTPPSIAELRKHYRTS